MSAPKLRAVPSPTKKRLALDLLSTRAEIGKIERIVQRGREPETARYTIEMADGRTVRVGTIRVLSSQAEMGKVLAVTIGCMPPPIEAKDWRLLVTAIVNHALEVDEAPGETFADTVRDWLADYAKDAGTDANGCCATRRPFVDDGWLHIHVADLARSIRRQYSASVKEGELRVALADLGFERVTMNYTRGQKRSTTSYYRAPTDVLDSGDVLGQ